MSTSPFRLLLTACWAPALTATLYLTIGRLGFSPTDEGLMQAYSYRIIAGQVPHRDFISPRPLGSALLHLIDFAIPGPLFEVARVIALCEYTACALLVAWLVYETVPWRWGTAAVVGAIGSVLVNLNVFLLTTWYTVDGLLLIAAGVLLTNLGARRRSSVMQYLGFLLLGMALLTKQSFFLAPLLGWLMILPRLRSFSGWLQRLRELLVTGAFSAAPGLAYVTTIAMLGGLSETRTQLLSGPFVYGSELVTPFKSAHDLRRLTLILGVEAALLVVIRVTRRPGGVGERHRLLRLPQLAARLVLSGIFVALPLYADFGVNGPLWGVRLVWMLVVLLAARAVLFRSFDRVGLSILAMAWMAMLSWGYPWPNLICGSVVLYMLHRAWVDVDWFEQAPIVSRATLISLGLVALMVTALMFHNVRTRVIYEDLPSGSLTASLGTVSPAFGGIHTNPRTREWLSQIRTCVRRYPARWVAVLPENAAVYPALRLHNPFPIDWMWPDDFKGSYAGLLATADWLNSEGDYLVLFQTADVQSLHPLQAANADSQIFRYPDRYQTPSELYQRLSGERTACGSFIAVHAAAT